MIDPRFSRLRLPGLRRFVGNRVGLSMRDEERRRCRWRVTDEAGRVVEVRALDAEAAAARAWVRGSRFGRPGAVLRVALFLRIECGFTMTDVEQEIRAEGPTFLEAARAASAQAAAWRRRIEAHRRVHVYDLERHDWIRGPLACGRRDRVRFSDGTVETVRRGGR